MAYIKYKELAYCRFSRKIDVKELPKFVFDYVEQDENIWCSYSSFRKKLLLTDRKIIIFLQKGIFGKTKKIHFFPYVNISSSAIEYKDSSTSLLFSMDSGYQLTINLANTSPSDKTELRQMYFKLIEKIGKKETNN